MQAEDFYNILDNQGLLNEETVEQLKRITENYPYFQLGWMVYLKNLKVVNSPDYESVLKKVAIRVSNRKKLYNFLHSKTAIKFTHEALDFNNPSNAFKLEDDSILNNRESLIDKFLQSKPERIRPRYSIDLEQNGDENNGIAENPVLEDEEIITETLADIYFQQKNYDKAIESFGKLSLKYPEKSVYFASRIEEIENLKNINKQ